MTTVDYRGRGRGIAKMIRSPIREVVVPIKTGGEGRWGQPIWGSSLPVGLEYLRGIEADVFIFGHLSDVTLI